MRVARSPAASRSSIPSGARRWATRSRPRACRRPAAVWEPPSTSRARALEHGLGLVEAAPLDERLDEHAEVQQAIEERRLRALGVERGARVCLGPRQVAAPQREQSAQPGARGEERAVAARAGVRDRRVEEPGDLVEALGPEQGAARVEEPRRVGDLLQRARGEGAPGQPCGRLGRLVAEDRARRADRERVPRQRLRAPRALAQRPGAALDRGRRRLVDHADADRRALEHEPEHVLVRAERGGGAVEHVERVGRSQRPRERVAEHERGGRTRLGVGRGQERGLEVRLPVREAGAGVGDPELEQQRGAPARRRRLGQRAAQVRGGDLGRAAAGRRAGGLVEPVDDPRVAGGVAQEEVLGDPLRAAARIQEPGGVPVPARTVGSGELAVDPGADDRVREGERSAGRQDLRRRELIRGDGRLVDVEPGERRRVREAGGLEDRERARQPRRRAPAGGRAGAAPSARPRAPRSRRSTATAAAVGRTPASRSGGDELPHEERRAAGEVRARRDEARLRGRAEPVLDHQADAGAAQASRADRLGERVARERAQRVRVGRRLGAHGDEQGDGKLLQARQQEREVAERGAVRPVRVVDGEAERPERREVGAEPVEPVQDRERRVDPRRGGVRVRTGQPEHARGDARRAAEQLRALAGRRLGERRLEELPRDPERELTLELGPARAQHAHPLAGRERARGREERRLPDPRRALDDDQRAAAGARVRQR